MNSKNDGGFVYPSDVTHGITRRDWLAGLAMQGLISNSDHFIASIESADKKGIEADEAMAKMAYLHADAMIAESNK